jgi:hypothetical protein
MKSIILKSALGIALLLTPAIETIASQNEKQVYASEQVYICTGPSAKRYHKSASCRGLSRCSGEIIKVSKSEAQSRGKTPCKMCYK